MGHKTLVERVGQALIIHQYMLATAESCTGGEVAQAITSIAGSSQWFERGFITYTNTAKQEMLEVSCETLQAYGAVSQQTVSEMAEGALTQSHAQVSVAISGIAGPGGGTPDKPVGTVWIAWACIGKPVRHCKYHFKGDRDAVRYRAVECALTGILEYLGE